MIVHLTDEQPDKVDLLVLGAGWTSTFLLPLLKSEGIKHAATTTTGHDGTIAFKFDPESSDPRPFSKLSNATTILITFPLKGKGPSERLVKLYLDTRKDDGAAQSGTRTRPQFIQLGVTSVWPAPTWQDSSSPYDTENPRAIAEDELMAIPEIDAAVLSLAGLYGAQRQPRNWVDRVIKSKEDLRAKGALHVIHGEDVSRAVVALHRNFTKSQRWLLCDMHVYDWWDLVQDWAVADVAPARAAELSAEQVETQRVRLKWVGELMVEEGVRALPRDASAVGRALDGRAFWNKMGIWPSQGRIR
ncbi:uncharacterized protein B0I36DRAFT_364589 [Microdochium trichocladiopsis]|uniref:Uncharacterized protein n=1 Tax=Microdochium trichocladiopsis TaxID=1682393 RepID=A0A9P8Y1Z2_9PEZI|nr:uncharacterized protein B0I36DRAFT_364589 [Microdochium trichocladiopsis]KAH7027379.1 hypothetical protein B0I36DRAFT_364589 [Microdochium trichocladiopsis]